MKVTIITVSFNSASTIETTLQSVVAQSDHRLQHIIIDGGSTDATLDVINRYAPIYGNRLILISEPDHGLYDAMNKGMALATGSVVGFLNSDDYFVHNHVVADIITAFEQNPGLDAVYADVVYINPQRPDKISRYYSSRRFSRGRMRLGFMPAHPTFYCRKETLEHAGQFDTRFKVAADFEYLLRIIYRDRAAIRYVPDRWVTMRSGGISNRGLKSHLAIFADHRRAYLKHGLTVGLWLDWLRYPLRLLHLD
ncbi:MAG: glycosyltransferase [Muribaculaceae bacterium]|nr:glycosyltransferase [Muribaculaceae bacterium]